jgi:hypothetical protein
MNVLIEEEFYDIAILESVFDDPKFYNQIGLKGKITSVGYYHSFEKKKLVYMLPKVFMRDNEQTVFGVTKDELFDIELNSIKHRDEFLWIRQLLVYFYNSLNEFKRRISETKIIDKSNSLELNTNLGENEYTYLDLFLSFVNFYRKNKNTILYKHIEYKSNQAKKPKWEKTIRKTLPILTANKNPIYLEIKNRKKIINTEEELLTYFFSILNHFNKEHQLHLKIDSTYAIIKAEQFKRLQINGLSKLKKIKYKYFSDTLKRMYHLCEIYFKKTSTSGIKKKKEDFISVNNYNIIFEDMIDKLFSDKLNENKYNENISLNNLKYNDDGKIIDHIFDYQSLIDTSDIFYIGDSKYYKSGSEVGKLSKYKQFTYAKNVVQFNIDIWNQKEEYYKENIRYRDEITEGYNLTPNFFIYGYIHDVNNFDNDLINNKGMPIPSYHFKERLFDRDTMFVHQYEINFLYVLKSYTVFGVSKIEDFRIVNKKLFRDNFINFFNSSNSKFQFYELNISKEEAQKLVDANFKLLNGSVFYTIENKLLLAKYKEDNILENFIVTNQFLKLELK